jgi:hypothetical protein
MRMKFSIKTILLVSTFIAAGTSQALSQAQNDFARDRNFGVLDRPRPEYDALGVPVSSFLLYPQVNVAGTYNDNIFADETKGQGDMVVQIQPSLALKSQWSQHELDLTLHSSINRYADHGSENTDDYGASVFGKLDVLTSTKLTGSASYDLETEPREAESAARNTISPVQFSLWQSQLAATHQFNRLQVSLTGTWDSYNFLDGIDNFGGVVDEHFRNVEDTGETLRADYALSPDTALFLSGNLNQHAYSLQPPAVLNDFNSTGYEMLGGVNFQISSLIMGELSAGYLSQDYPGVQGQNLGSLALHGSVQWFPTELTTVTVKADRLVENSSMQNSAGYVTTGGVVQVDHELRYNVILSALGSYNDDTFQGLDREDQRWSVGLGAKYLFTREVGLALNFNHESLTSNGTARFVNFDINRVMLNLVLQR